MELLDILDENGNKTGEVEERSEVYRKGLWHRSCHIWIENDNKEILVQKRNPNKIKIVNTPNNNINNNNNYNNIRSSRDKEKERKQKLEEAKRIGKQNKFRNGIYCN